MLRHRDKGREVGKRLHVLAQTQDDLQLLDFLAELQEHRHLVAKATHIGGMTPEASQAYMRDLIDRMIQPEIVYHQVWRKGDVVIIDDRATMHRAHGDYDRPTWRKTRQRSPAHCTNLLSLGPH